MSFQQPNPHRPHWTVRAIAIFAGTIALIANLIAIFVFTSGRTSLQSFPNTPSSVSPGISTTFNSGSTSTSISNTPPNFYYKLKVNYSGTYTNGSNSGQLELKVNSEDEQGNVNITEHYPAAIEDCVGKVTIDKHITLRCSWGASISPVQGTIFTDGHIEATEKFDDGTVIHWNIS